ncbi:MAG TPA: VCBS repeat-containing protein [Terracidiphilus sp.]|jgi:hypothetical protein|nr:VCBS repeat-containing protein [Terracidiphilus sp.]
MSTHKYVLAILAAGTIACAASAQTTFSPRFDALNQYPSTQLQVDLNGDGIPDFLSFSSGSGLKELLSAGGGAYTLHTLSSESSYVPLASGDFNHDGKNDVLFYDYTGGSRLFVIGYGNGAGGFSSFEAAPNLPGVVTGELSTIVAETGDFNHDGRPDVAMAYQDNSNSSARVIRVVLFLNNGSGFTNAGTIYQYNMPQGSQGGVTYDNSPEFDLRIGDYDADGHGDLALRYLITPPDNPVQPSESLVVLYGNGAGKFTPVTVFANRQSDMVINSADLNDDGATDLVGASIDHTVRVFYGHTNRTFTQTVLSSSSSNGALNYAPQIADFDGNGLKDIAFAADDTAANSNDSGIRVLYQTARGVFSMGAYTKTDNFNINSVGEYPFTDVFVGDYNHNMKPDVSLFLSDVSANHSDSLGLMLNTGSHTVGTCAPPALGIHVCSPGSTASSTSVAFNLSATSFYRLRKMEIWVDGVKKSETYHVFGTQGYDQVKLTLPAGKHTVGLYAVAFDESMALHTSFALTVP